MMIMGRLTKVATKNEGDAGERIKVTQARAQTSRYTVQVTTMPKKGTMRRKKNRLVQKKKEAYDKCKEILSGSEGSIIN